MRTFLIYVIVSPVLFAGICLGDTIHVPADYPEVQQAINASSGGDTVVVAPGTYVENIDFQGKAITVKSSQGPKRTTLDGNRMSSVAVFLNGEGADSVLHGFTITNGAGIYRYPNEYYGGGVYCLNSSPILSGNIFKDNQPGNGSPSTTFEQGGGIYAEYSSPTIIENEFLGNKADSGGAISFFVSHALVKNNYFNQNFNGAVFGYEYTGTVANCFFLENHGWYGAAVSFEDDSDAYIYNCTFHSNISEKEGGALYCYLFSTVTVKNCIFWENKAPKGPQISITSNSYPATLNIDHSDVDGGQGGIDLAPGCTLNWGAGMIDADPEIFYYSSNLDRHLPYSSPCKDTGDNSIIAPGDTDFEGDPRVADGTVDMGWDEFYPHLYDLMEMLYPGRHLNLRVVGDPGTAPVILWVGSGVMDPPLPLVYGDWHLALPLLLQMNLGPIPAGSFFGLSVRIPASVPSNIDIPIQAIVGNRLTNLCVLQIQ